ncbi:MAG: methylated-DNA--[protein]-cysteine S-methyltransferase [Proteobacteria bacterium]|nr:methylated-DNA--[protein]-cysteine S-methyltransferase [Pseudomonadota bacterium]
MIYTNCDSPCGELLLVTDGTALTDLHMTAGRYVPAVAPDWVRADDHPILVQARRELDDYFAGRRRTFSVPLAPRGTPFQQAAWAALVAIPYGQTRSYAQQARAINRPTATRAVGAANGRNPIAILIPCHRVVGSNGSLTGYAGGMERKTWLLGLEQGGSNARYGCVTAQQGD